jgi:hypothetical protein
MKTILQFATILVFTAMLTSCKKEDFATAGFRCKVDGKEFIGAKELTTAQFTSPNRIRIRTTKVKNITKPSEPYGEMELDFNFDVSDFSKPIPITMNVFYYGNNGGNTLRSNALNPGVINLTNLDLTANKVAGTYSLTAYDDNNNTKAITEGGFDLELK